MNIYLNRMLLKGFFLLACFFFSSCSKSSSLGLTKKKAEVSPSWMTEQIQQDFSYFRDHPVSQKQLDALFYSPKGVELHLIRFIIDNGNVSFEMLPVSDDSYHRRAKMMTKAFVQICKELSVPNMQFLLALHDSIDFDIDIPIFVMAKSKNLTRQILIPDFDAIRGKFQVLKKKDLTSYYVPWNEKKGQLIWRGSTAQAPIEIAPGHTVFNRVILCELSKLEPKLIDAKFTSFVQMKEPLRTFALQFKGEFLPYTDLMNYKYQLLIDGNTCAYTNSGWKLFANSVLFKVDSDNIQWYYNYLKPYEHFIPVKADLSDLVEKIRWAQEHDQEAATIAANARNFACSHLKRVDALMYLYYVLEEYAKIIGQADS